MIGERRDSLPASPRSRVLVAAVLLTAVAVTVPAPLYAAAEGENGGGLLSLVAKLSNFAILVGVLVYFLKSPLLAFLASRIVTVKEDLAGAKAMRIAAETQLADIARRLDALPAEIEALEKQGGEDVRAEQARITQVAAAERERLLEQTRREIDMRLRIARRELTAHAAELAVGVARQRIARAITPEDQVRLVDRYAAQLREAR
jgi:F-type H+-transporting ATPase subunit b